MRVTGRRRTLSCFVALLLASPLPGRGQPASLPGGVSVLPPLPAGAQTLIKQISRDGRRALFLANEPSSAQAFVVVRDIDTGAVLFDSRPLQTSTRVFVDAVLTPDGRHIVYGATGTGALATRLPDSP